MHVVAAEEIVMIKKLLPLMLLAGSSVFGATRFAIGIGIGGYPPPPPPPVYYYAPPPAPGIGYAWVPGYYYPVGPRYVWRTGYWARPPYIGARWIAPRYVGRRYYGGYWRR